MRSAETGGDLARADDGGSAFDEREKTMVWTRRYPRPGSLRSLLETAGAHETSTARLAEGSREYRTPARLEVGESLSQRIARQRKLPPGEALQIGSAVADMMAATHDAGLLHLGLGIGNVFLGPSEGDGAISVNVLGFGSWKANPDTMSPEQITGRRVVDHRSDIYSLGCLLFELLAGRLPFVGSQVEVAFGHRSLTPPSVREFAPEVPREVEVLIGRMLEKEPARRPETMLEIAHALSAARMAPTRKTPRRLARGSLCDTPHTVFERAPRCTALPGPRWRRRIVLMAAAGLIALTGALLLASS
jgi:hypothetical protein